MLSRQGGRKEVNIVKTRRHKANFVKYKPASQLSTDQGRKVEDNFQGQDQGWKMRGNFLKEAGQKSGSNTKPIKISRL